MGQHRAWFAISAAILVGAAVGGAIAAATQNDDDIFQGGPLPTPSDWDQAEVDHYSAEVEVALGPLGQLDLAGKPCPEGVRCDEFGPPPAALDQLEARCLRIDLPASDPTAGSDRAQALLDALNAVCGRAAQTRDRPPATDAEFNDFARASMPQLLDAFKFATGREWGSSDDVAGAGR